MIKQSSKFHEEEEEDEEADEEEEEEEEVQLPLSHRLEFPAWMGSFLVTRGRKTTTITAALTECSCSGCCCVLRSKGGSTEPETVLGKATWE